MVLLRKRDPNPPYKPFFKVLNLATICESCTADKRSFCPHNLQNRAVWKSMKTENRLRGLMPDKYFRKEILGEQISTTEYLFDPKLLDTIFGVPCIKATPGKIVGNTVHIAIDPCSGGSGSKIGITAVCYTEHPVQLIVSPQPHSSDLSTPAYSYTHLQNRGSYIRNTHKNDQGSSASAQTSLPPNPYQAHKKQLPETTSATQHCPPSSSSQYGPSLSQAHHKASRISPQPPHPTLLLLHPPTAQLPSTEKMPLTNQQVLASMSLTQDKLDVEQITDLIYKQFIRPMRTIMAPVIRSAHYHIAIEANHNWTIAGYIANVFVKFAHSDQHRVTFTRQANNPEKIGFWTSHQSKEMGIDIIRSIMRSNNFIFDLNFIGQKDILKDQLSRIRRVRTPAKLDVGDRYFITGKTTSCSGIDNQDDQAMSVIIVAVSSHDWLDTTNAIPSKRLRL